MADDIRTEPEEAEDAAGETTSGSPPSALSFPLYDLYLEQQRRLACPGCGEEAFLG